MIYDHRCRQCGKPLALADIVCAACGHAVPADDRRAILEERADSQAGDGNYAEASRTLELVLRQELPEDEARLLWRKRGVWLLRSGRPEFLDAAEASMAEALRLDDNDDLGHQLWMDLLNRRGQLEKARSWYAERLRLNPSDAMAQRQMTVLKLSADFKTAPRPRLELGAAPQGLFAKALKPSGAKTAMAAMGFLTNGAIMLRALLGSPINIRGLGPFTSFLSMVNDPWMPGIQAALCLAYLIWGWQERRRG